MQSICQAKSSLTSPINPSASSIHDLIKTRHLICPTCFPGALPTPSGLRFLTLPLGAALSLLQASPTRASRTYSSKLNWDHIALQAETLLWLQKAQNKAWAPGSTVRECVRPPTSLGATSHVSLELWPGWVLCLASRQGGRSLCISSSSSWTALHLLLQTPPLKYHLHRGLPRPCHLNPVSRSLHYSPS